MIELVRKLLNKNIIKYGDFTFKSGLKSNVYIDLRSLISYPKLLKEVMDLMYQKIRDSDLDYDLICGIAYSGIPMATILSQSLEKPMIVIRKEKKEYGTGKLIEGEYNNNQKCLMIDDVITTGSSLIESINILKNENLIIKDIIVFIDRRLERNDVKEYNVISIFKMDEIMNAINIIKKSDNIMINKLYECMYNKKTNLVLSADISDHIDLLSLVEMAGPHICILKVHCDMMKYFPVKQLKEMSEKYKFFIMEDRKFSDIGNTTKYQYGNDIVDWADFVTVHSLMGPDTIKSINDVVNEYGYSNKRGIFLVAEASSKDNLINDYYTQKTIEFAQQYKNIVCGFISQHNLNNNCFVYATPGINIDHNGDNMGQQYNSPENAILDRGTDLIIVGRGIYESDNTYFKLLEYKNRGWNSFIKKKMI